MSVARKKRTHWQQVNTRNPKAYVTQPARPDSAKEDLRRFVQENQLQYRHRPHQDDDLTSFEALFDQLQLDDGDLLERADRRDLPAHIQRLWSRETSRLAHTPQLLTVSAKVPSSLANSPDGSINRGLSCRKGPPARRSVVPNTILDDYAYRRYNQGSSAILLHQGSSLSGLTAGANSHSRHSPLDRRPSASYLSLVTYDHLPQDRPSLECLVCEGFLEHRSDEPCPVSSSRKQPDLVTDDVLNRLIRQSSGAKVPAPQPPFGIPNSPVISFVHTFPQSDYSRVEPDLSELQRRQCRSRHRYREPHLVNDDMAFRSLRKDYKQGCKLEEEQNFWRGQLLARSASTPNLAIEQLRLSLRPLKPASLTSGSSSPTSLESAVFNYCPPPPSLI